MFHDETQATVLIYFTCNTTLLFFDSVNPGINAVLLLLIIIIRICVKDSLTNLSAAVAEPWSCA